MAITLATRTQGVMQLVQEEITRSEQNTELCPHDQAREAEEILYRCQGDLFGWLLAGKDQYHGPHRVAQQPAIDHPLSARFRFVACNYRGPMLKGARRSLFLVDAPHLSRQLSTRSTDDPHLGHFYDQMLKVYFELFDRERTFNECLLDTKDPELSKLEAVLVRFADEQAPAGIVIAVNSEGTAMRIGVSKDLSRALAVDTDKGISTLDEWRRQVWASLLGSGVCEPSGPKYDPALEAVERLGPRTAELEVLLDEAEKQVLMNAGGVCQWAKCFFPDLGRLSAIRPFLRMLQGMLFHVGHMGSDIATIVVPSPECNGTRSSVTMVAEQNLAEEWPPTDERLERWLELRIPYMGVNPSIHTLACKSEEKLKTGISHMLDNVSQLASHIGIEAPLWKALDLLTRTSQGRCPYWYQALGTAEVARCLLGERHEGMGLCFGWLVGPPEILKRVDATISNEERNFWVERYQQLTFEHAFSGVSSGEPLEGLIERAAEDAAEVYKAHFAVFQMERVAGYVDPRSFPHGIGLSRIVRLPFPSRWAITTGSVDAGTLAPWAFASTGFAANPDQVRNDVFVIVAGPGNTARMFVAGKQVAKRVVGGDRWRPGPDLGVGKLSQRERLEQELSGILGGTPVLKPWSRTLASLLMEISEAKKTGCLLAVLASEPNGESLYHDLTAGDMMMRWGAARPLQHMDRSILKSLLLMDGATVVSVSNNHEVRARKQLSADTDIFETLRGDRDKLLEALTFGTKHRSALAFSKLAHERNVIAKAFTVSADGAIRVFQGPTWTELGD